MVEIFGVDEFIYEVSPSILFSRNIYCSKKLEVLCKTLYLLKVFDEMGLLCLVFSSDLIRDQLRVTLDSEVGTTHFYG